MDLQQQQQQRRQLRRALDSMFPPDYLARHHKNPLTTCSLLQTRCGRPANDGDPSRQADQCAICSSQGHCRVSSEPSSRSSLIRLRAQLGASLREHQAQSGGLCPIRRSIYRQLFAQLDELIRQVTVACVEQGQLLLAVRDELEESLEASRRLYRSGLDFGLRKVLDSELQVEQAKHQSRQLEMEARAERKRELNDKRKEELELMNKLDCGSGQVDYYKSELARKEQVIEQQRAIIRALSQEAASDIKTPNWGSS